MKLFLELPRLVKAMTNSAVSAACSVAVLLLAAFANNCCWRKIQIRRHSQATKIGVIRSCQVKVYGPRQKTASSWLTTALESCTKKAFAKAERCLKLNSRKWPSCQTQIILRGNCRTWHVSVACTVLFMPGLKIEACLSAMKLLSLWA